MATRRKQGNSTAGADRKVAKGQRPDQPNRRRRAQGGGQREFSSRANQAAQDTQVPDAVPEEARPTIRRRDETENGLGFIA